MMIYTTVPSMFVLWTIFGITSLNPFGFYNKLQYDVQTTFCLGGYNRHAWMFSDGPFSLMFPHIHHNTALVYD